jgi:hypothetical protein
METLPPDTPAFDKPDLSPCGCEPDRCDPARRATPQNNDHGISVYHKEKNLVFIGMRDLIS